MACDNLADMRNRPCDHEFGLHSDPLKFLFLCPFDVVVK